MSTFSWSKILITRATSRPIFFSFYSTFDSFSSGKFPYSRARATADSYFTDNFHNVTRYRALSLTLPRPAVAERRKRRNKAEIEWKKSTREKRGDKEGDGAREELWKKRNFHGGREKRETERRTSKLTRDEAVEIRATKNAREKRTGEAARLLCKEGVAFFSRVSVRFISHSKALWINIALRNNARADQQHLAYGARDVMRNVRQQRHAR